MATFSYTQLPVIGESSSAAASHIIDSFQKIAAHVNGANVDYTNIANNAVRTAQIQDLSVTFAKLDSTSGSEAVQTSVIKDGAITVAKLNATSGSEAVQTSVIKDEAVTSAKIAPAAKITYYTSLPAGTSWTDGQLIMVEAPSFAGGSRLYPTRMLLRWNATDGAWDAVNSVPIHAVYSVLGFTTSNYLSNSGALLGNTLTLPNKGTYLCKVYAQLDVDATSGTGAQTNVGYKIGFGSNATDMEGYGWAGSIYQYNASTPEAMSGIASRLYVASATNTTIGVYVRALAANRSVTCNNALVEVIPLRLIP